MNPTQQLHDLCPCLWLDNISRGIAPGGSLRRYICDFPATGLTSNPMILDKAIEDTHFYDDAIHKKALPEKTLRVSAEHGRVTDALPVDGGDTEEILAEFARAGANDADLAATLERAGTESFTKSWTDLLNWPTSRSVMLKRADRAGRK